jgi:hypothetical protein
MENCELWTADERLVTRVKPSPSWLRLVWFPHVKGILVLPSIRVKESSVKVFSDINPNYASSLIFMAFLQWFRYPMHYLG